MISITAEERRQLVERVKALLAECHDFNTVATMLSMTSAQLRNELKWINPHIYYPDHTLVKMYRQYMPVHVISRKSRVSISNIIRALQKEAGYITFAERFGNTKYTDLARQAAFCKGRNSLIALYYKRGWTLSDLEFEFGLPYNFLKQVLKEAGFTFEEYFKHFRSPGCSRTQRRNEKIYDEYKAGATIEELCERYELTEKSIRAIIMAKQKKYFPLTGMRKRETYKTDTKMKFRKKFS
jgi:hypothetical protein